MGHPRLDGSPAQPRPKTWCHPARPYGARGLCRDCYSKWKDAQNPEAVKVRQRRHSTKRTPKLYGLTVEDYDKAVLDQKGLCKICRRPPVGKTRLSIDHEHRTKVFRGLLCDPCNTAIGFLQEQPELCRRAARYIETSGGV